MWGRRPGGLALGKDRRYRLLRQISEDPIGTLWQAEDAFANRAATIRLLREDLGANERFRLLLRAELRAVWPRLKHPNVAVVIYYTELDRRHPATLSNIVLERPCFVVMQALDGVTLAQRLGRSGTLEPAEARRIGSQVQEALAAAHEIGMVHGGLTPHSVLLTPGGGVKVLDFGIPTALWVFGREARATVGDSSNGHLGEPAARVPDRSDDERGLQLLMQRMISGPPVAAEDDLPRLVDLVLVPPSETIPAVVRPPQGPGRRRRHVLAGVASSAKAPWRAIARWGRWAGAVGRAPRRANTSTVAGGAALVAVIATAVVLMTSLPSSEPPEQPPSAARTTAPSPTPRAVGVTVPDVGGLSAMEAGKVLNRMGLLVIDAEPTPGPPGKVVGTDPAVSEIVDPGTPIVLYVGASPERLEDES